MTKAAKEILERYKSLSRKGRQSLLREIDEFELETAPIPEWHKKALEEALEDERKNPDDWVPWEEVYAELLSKYDKRKPAKGGK